MTAPEIYATILAYAFGFGVALGLIALAFKAVALLLTFCGLLTALAIETVFTDVLPALPRLAFTFITLPITTTGKAMAARKARHARGIALPEDEPEWQSRAREEAKAEAAIARIDGWEAACKLLGLPQEGFTHARLSTAYRKAMRAAHPDLGGSPARAKAINIARDLIRKELGWS